MIPKYAVTPATPPPNVPGAESIPVDRPPRPSFFPGFAEAAGNVFQDPAQFGEFLKENPQYGMGLGAFGLGTLMPGEDASIGTRIATGTLFGALTFILGDFMDNPDKYKALFSSLMPSREDAAANAVRGALMGKPDRDKDGNIVLYGKKYKSSKEVPLDVVARRTTERAMNAVPAVAKGVGAGVWGGIKGAARGVVPAVQGMWGNKAGTVGTAAGLWAASRPFAAVGLQRTRAAAGRAAGMLSNPDTAFTGYDMLSHVLPKADVGRIYASSKLPTGGLRDITNVLNESLGGGSFWGSLGRSINPLTKRWGPLANPSVAARAIPGLSRYSSVAKFIK